VKTVPEDIWATKWKKRRKRREPVIYPPPNLKKCPTCGYTWLPKFQFETCPRCGQTSLVIFDIWYGKI
jgi:rubrerythrin